MRGKAHKVKRKPQNRLHSAPELAAGAKDSFCEVKKGFYLRSARALEQAGCAEVAAGATESRKVKIRPELAGLPAVASRGKGKPRKSRGPGLRGPRPGPCGLPIVLNCFH